MSSIDTMLRGLVGFVLLVFLHLASTEASISVQDAVPSFTPLTGFERLVDEQAIPGFKNGTGFSQPLSSALGFLNHSAQCQPSSEIDALIGNGFDGTTAVSLVIAFVGMGLLMTDTHFSRPVCAAVSLGFWPAVLWIGSMLSLKVGVGLAVVAVWKRESWLLFPKKKGGPVVDSPQSWSAKKVEDWSPDDVSQFIENRWPEQKDVFPGVSGLELMEYDQAAMEAVIDDKKIAAAVRIAVKTRVKMEAKEADGAGLPKFKVVCATLDDIAKSTFATDAGSKEAALKRVQELIDAQKPFVTDLTLLDRLKPLDKNILLVAKDSASSVDTVDDRDLLDETADPEDKVYLEDDVDCGRILRSRTRSATVGALPEAAASAAAPETPARKPAPPNLSTPASVATSETVTMDDGVDVATHFEISDWKPKNKFRTLPVGGKHLAMRKHKFGNEHPCRGVIPEKDLQCCSLHQGQKLTLSEDATPLCAALNELVKLTLTLLEENVGEFTENNFQSLHMPALRVLCKCLSNDLNVHDVRSAPYLTLEENGSYFTGYGDTVITLTYPFEPKNAEIVVCTNELKPKILTVSNGMGQVAGQTMHFNGRHCRSRIFENIINQMLHLCCGVLSNPVSSVGLTLTNARNEARNEAVFLVEAVEGDTMGCIATMLARALKVRDIVMGAGSIDEALPIQVNGIDGSGGGDPSPGPPKEAGGDEGSELPDEGTNPGRGTEGGATLGTRGQTGGSEPTETQGPLVDSLNLDFDADYFDDTDDELIVIKTSVPLPQIRVVSEKHQKIAMTDSAITRFIASGVFGAY